MTTELPDLRHLWYQPAPISDPTWWACRVAGCLCTCRDLPPETLCPERVIRFGLSQRQEQRFIHPVYPLDLAHKWQWNKINNLTVCADCGVVRQTPMNTDYSPVCHIRASVWGSEQRAAGAEEERSVVVSWLREVAETADHNGDRCAGRIMEVAYSIEVRDHREVHNG